MSADRAGLLTDVAGVAVGHWTDPVARTGCTVVIVPEGTVASGEIRGGGPASREVALLDPNRHVAAIDAVVLTGGSAFGLATADGVMSHLESMGRGYVTPAGRVPIVPTLGLYDLAVGDAAVRPDA
ncbi:MAG TPA: P1 family peptidase, partial [Acidimicrobiales bacterium]|nr:P1 family peptidase [Acidimicrobiales bacterium]